MQFHEACSLFPEMSVEEFNQLCEDVKKHGVLEPVTVHDGQIIDGRARFKASQVVGCEVRQEKWNGQGGSIFAFIASRNLHRRNLTTSQRAAIGAELQLKLTEEYKSRRNACLKRGTKTPDRDQSVSPKRASADAAKIVGANATYVATAAKILELAPEKFEDLKRGDKTMQQVKREMMWIQPLMKPRKTSDSSSKKPGDDRARFIEEAIGTLRKIKTRCDEIDGMDSVEPLVSKTIKALKMAAVEFLSQCAH